MAWWASIGRQPRRCRSGPGGESCGRSVRRWSWHMFCIEGWRAEGPHNRPDGPKMWRRGARWRCALHSQPCRAGPIHNPVRINPVGKRTNKRVILLLRRGLGGGRRCPKRWPSPRPWQVGDRPAGCGATGAGREMKGTGSPRSKNGGSCQAEEATWPPDPHGSGYDGAAGARAYRRRRRQQRRRQQRRIVTSRRRVPIRTRRTAPCCIRSLPAPARTPRTSARRTPPHREPSSHSSCTRRSTRPPARRLRLRVHTWDTGLYAQTGCRPWHARVTRFA